MNASRDEAHERLPASFDAQWALFLDVDGTLLDHADDPASVVLATGLCDTLRQLYSDTQGALALVSGRSVASLDQLFAPCAFPAAGQHGLEIRHAQGHLVPDPRARQRNAKAVAALRAQVGQLANVTVEDKGLSVPLHYRRAPYLRERLQGLARDLVRSLGQEFHIIDGADAIEIKSGAAHKGSAIDSFMQDRVFLGRRPVYVGDDTTDEDGFALVNANNGISIKVGTGHSIAPWRASNPAAVRRWLAAYAEFFEAARRHARP